MHWLLQCTLVCEPMKILLTMVFNPLISKINKISKLTWQTCMVHTQTILAKHQRCRGITGPAVALHGYVHILQTSMDPNKSSFKEGSNQEEPNLSLTNIK